MSTRRQNPGLMSENQRGFGRVYSQLKKQTSQPILEENLLEQNADFSRDHNREFFSNVTDSRAHYIHGKGFWNSH
jgi:hypothetical protein